MQDFNIRHVLLGAACMAGIAVSVFGGLVGYQTYLAWSVRAALEQAAEERKAQQAQQEAERKAAEELRARTPDAYALVGRWHSTLTGMDSGTAYPDHDGAFIEGTAPTLEDCEEAQPRVALQLMRVASDADMKALAKKVLSSTSTSVECMKTEEALAIAGIDWETPAKEHYDAQVAAQTAWAKDHPETASN